MESKFGHDDLRLSVKIQSAKKKAVGPFDWGCLEGIMHFNQDPSRLPHNIRDESPSSDGDEESSGWPTDESEATANFVEMKYFEKPDL